MGGRQNFELNANLLKESFIEIFSRLELKNFNGKLLQAPDYTSAAKMVTNFGKPYLRTRMLRVYE